MFSGLPIYKYLISPKSNRKKKVETDFYILSHQQLSQKENLVIWVNMKIPDLGVQTKNSTLDYKETTGFRSINQLEVSF